MPPPKTAKEQMDEYVANWKVVSVESERLRAARLRRLTEAEAAEQFNALDCDPALYWIPEERRHWSGLIEQQRLFSLAHEHASRLRRPEDF